jgi:5-formyltetrahydrofolate cyclo-ligase
MDMQQFWKLIEDVRRQVPDPADGEEVAARAAALLSLIARRTSASQAGYIPSRRGSCERYALSLVAAGSDWSLPLLSSFLSAAWPGPDTSAGCVED